MRNPLLCGLFVGVVLLLGAVVFARNTSAAPSEASSASNAVAQASCQGITQLAAARGRVDLLSGAFVTTAADFTAWQDTRYGLQAQGPRIRESMWKQMPPTSLLTVCFFDGQFDTAFSRPWGAKVAPYERLVMVIDGTGQAFLETAGYRATTLVERPVRKP